MAPTPDRGWATRPKVDDPPSTALRRLGHVARLFASRVPLQLLSAEVLQWPTGADGRGANSRGLSGLRYRRRLLGALRCTMQTPVHEVRRLGRCVL